MRHTILGTWFDERAIISGGPAFALRDDGVVMCSHFSTNASFGRLDLGFIDGQDWSKKREIYAAECPDGYDLVWIEDPKTDLRWKAAMDLNRAARPSDKESA